METLASRLAHAMTMRGRKITPLAAAAGMTYQGVKKILDGKTSTIKADSLFPMATYLKVDPTWLSTGEGPMEARTTITAHQRQAATPAQAVAIDLKPLERDGVDYFAVVEADGTQATVITSDELDLFVAAAAQADVVSDTVAERVLLQVESAVFRDGNKWRLSDGGQPFHAEIADPVFLASIDAGDARFGKGDMLLADVRQVQTLTDNGLKAERYVVKVHEHRSPLQPRLL